MGKMCKVLSHYGTVVMVCHMSPHLFLLKFVSLSCVWMYTCGVLAQAWAREDSCPRLPVFLCCSAPYFLLQGGPGACCGQAGWPVTPRTLMSLAPFPQGWVTGLPALLALTCELGIPVQVLLLVAGTWPLSHLLDHTCVSSSQCPSASPSADGLHTSPVVSRMPFLAAFLCELGHSLAWIMLCI